MKKLGIIGGAGPLASSLFYETLVKYCYLNTISIPEICLINYPFTRGLSINESCENGSILQKELQCAITALKSYGADAGVIVCNTLHIYLDKLHPEIPFMHLPKLVMQEAALKRHSRLLILATQNSCQNKLYSHPEITSIYPLSEEQLLLDKIIDALLKGAICESDAFLLSQMIEEIEKREHVDGVVLGCTDLPVLHHHYPIQCRTYLYDSIKIPTKHILRGLL